MHETATSGFKKKTSRVILDLDTGSSTPQEPREPRPPIFTDRDLQNPCWCLVKGVGILALLPLYLAWFVVCDCGWMDHADECLHRCVILPLAYMLDLVYFVGRMIAYIVYTCLLRPLYVLVLVPLWRVWRYDTSFVPVSRRQLSLFGTRCLWHAEASIFL